jgi:hypothetical protein
MILFILAPPTPDNSPHKPLLMSQIHRDHQLPAHTISTVIADVNDRRCPVLIDLFFGCLLRGFLRESRYLPPLLLQEKAGSMMTHSNSKGQSMLLRIRGKV